MRKITDLERKLWSHWISEEYHSEESVHAIASELNARPHRPISLPGFCPLDRANRLSNAFQNLQAWTHKRHVLRASSDQTDEVDMDGWSASPKAERFSSQEYADNLRNVAIDNLGLEREDQSIIQQFLLFTVVGPGLRSWLSRVVSRSLSEYIKCELTRYRHGDFIRPHTDALDGRLLGINYYFDSNWKRRMGGELIYRNELNSETKIEPRYNSISILPIDSSCTHEVKPWRAKNTGRMAFCMSVRPA